MKEPFRPLRVLLLVYEFLRLLFLVAVFSALRPDGDGTAGFPWLVYAAPNALFPLMALFLFLNLTRYEAYLPLFLAGKCICLFSIFGWSLFLRQSIRIAEYSGDFYFPVIPELIAGILMCGDTLAAIAVYFIIKKIKAAEPENRVVQEAPAQEGE